MSHAQTTRTLIIAIGTTAWVGQASAETCERLSLPNTILVSGSTAVQPFLGKTALALAGASGSDQFTVLYSAAGSCKGVEALAADTDPSAACSVGSGCLTGTAVYWKSGDEPNKPTGTCDLPTNGRHIDLTLSDVYAKSCAGVDVSSMGDTGFVAIPMGFIVNPGSDQVAIDAREAYYAYGMGEKGKVNPWTVNDFLLQRNSGSGTQITVFSNVHVPVASAIGVDTGGTSKMITQVGSSTNPEATLGFAGLDQVDLYRDKVRILAYRHWEQNDYFYPDSTHSSFDKQNVRDGHYPVWGYEHAVLHVDSSGKAVNEKAQQLVDIFAGVSALPGTDSVALYQTQTGLVPTCAMKVQRSEDGGDISPYQPSEPCGCFFEKNVTTGSTQCTTCTKDTDCESGQMCSLGYCEAKGN